MFNPSTDEITVKIDFTDAEHIEAILEQIQSADESQPEVLAFSAWLICQGYYDGLVKLRELLKKEIDNAGNDGGYHVIGKADS
ncbi:MAG: hypothetical protein RLZZ176_412 [Cyanobacteriota bacterium]